MQIEDYTTIRDRDTAAHVLAFAAGARTDVPDHIVAHPEETVEFLFRHRVIGRLIAAIDTANRADLAQLRELALEAHVRGTDKFKLLQVKLVRFVKQFCADIDVVVFKNHYYYQPSERVMRRTGDLDISVSKPALLLDRLKAAGLIEPHRVPMHEYANLEFEGEDVDLHRYYPAWNVIPFVTDIGRDGGSVGHSIHRCLETGLPVDELVRTGKAIELDGATFYVPSRATAAAITLAASHRDYLMHAAWFLRNNPPQRLSDLCEVMDSLDDPAFSKAEFIDVIGRHGLQDALRWMAGNIETVLGDSRLAELHRDAFGTASTAIGDDWMLRNVGGGFWLPFRRDAIRDLTTLIPTSEVTDALKVPATVLADGETKSIRLAEPAARDQVGIVLSGHVQLDVHCLEITRKGLDLHLTFTSGIEIAREYRAFLEINNETLEWDNLGTPDVVLFTSSVRARKALQTSSYDPARRVLKATYRLFEEQKDDELHLSLTTCTPTLPWEAERGCLVAMRFRLT